MFLKGNFWEWARRKNKKIRRIFDVMLIHALSRVAKIKNINGF